MHIERRFKSCGNEWGEWEDNSIGAVNDLFTPVFEGLMYGAQRITVRDNDGDLWQYRACHPDREVQEKVLQWRLTTERLGNQGDWQNNPQLSNAARDGIEAFLRNPPAWGIKSLIVIDDDNDKWEYRLV